MKFLLFDLDGTISDPKEGITKSLNYALEKLGYNTVPEKELEQYIGPPLRSTFSDLLQTDRETVLTDAIGYYRERYFSVGFKENNLYDGIESLLKWSVSMSCNNFIATSKGRDIATKIINYFGIRGYFKSIFGCDLDLTKSELIKQIIEDYCISKKLAFMIGDRRYDIEAAQDNDIQSIAVMWGYGSSEELVSHHPNFIAKDINELRKIIVEA